MNKETFLLKVLSIINTPLSPIQIQKLFFLLEKRLPKDAKYFEFKPYFYGPYDKQLTLLLNKLIFNNKIQVLTMNNVDYYQLNKYYFESTADFLDNRKKEFILEIIDFIKRKNFKELCFAIYNEFPEMKVNSVFNG